MSESKCDVAAYIWPSYSGNDLRARTFWPEGIGEWQSVHSAVKKFPEHNWPRKPLWGYVNEADPYVMEMEIEAAADHAVNVFIYDWYWYDRRPFLEDCLNDGYLKARNNGKVKFYLMWANHTVNNLWDKRISNLHNMIWDGALDRKEFEVIGGRWIERYFSHPSYYRIDGKPVLMIYDLNNLIRGLDGLDNTCSALDWLRDKCAGAGLGGLHLQAVMCGERTHSLPGGGETSTREVVEKLGFDSTTNYQMVSYTNPDRDYLEILPDVQKEWDRIAASYSTTYYPHVSVGWDTNPRFNDFVAGVVKNNTPANFEKALRMAKDYVDSHNVKPPLITLNSWNEWTETSYLQPDDLYGYGYLEAVKKVFG